MKPSPPPLLPLREAVRRVLELARPLPPEWVPLDAALDRVLAEDLRAPFDLPRADDSAVDGFALRSADAREPGARLRIAGTLPAGVAEPPPLAPGQAARIMTGAPLPPGADAVVMVERVQVEGPVPEQGGTEGGWITLPFAVEPGRNVRRRGEDLRSGSVVLRRGTRLGPGQLGVAASTGRSELLVARRPRVALLVTGDELARPGHPLPPGHRYSSNGSSLAALVRRAGGLPLDLGVAVDRPGELRAALQRARGADVLLTTGGVSLGDRDLVRELLAELGAEERFWRVAVKPGRPTAFALWERTAVFSFPGNPVSAVVAFLEFAWPYLRALQGDPRPFAPTVEAVLAEPVDKRPPRAWLYRVRLSAGPGGLEARLTGNQSSGVLSSVAAGHGYLLLPPDAGRVEAGSRVRVRVYDWGFLHREEPGYPW